MDPVQLVSVVFLILGGHVGLPVLIVTLAYSPAVAKRSLALVNFLLCIVMFATSLLVPYYSGTLVSGNPPGFVLCRVQSAMLHASGPLMSTAGFALVADALEQTSRMRTSVPTAAWKTIGLLALPWTVFLAFFLAFLITGMGLSAATEALLTQQPFLYCRFPSGLLLHLAFIVEMGGLFGILTTQVFVFMRIRDHVLHSREKGIVLPVPLITLMLRALVFVLYTFATLFALFLGSDDTPPIRTPIATYVVVSLIPLMAFLIFGTQTDLLRVWSCSARACSQPPDDHLSLDKEREIGMPRTPAPALTPVERPFNSRTRALDLG